MTLFRLSAIAMAAALVGPAVMAQSFLPNSLIVSRTVYEGVASTVSVGQALSGGGIATNNGLFPNVFKNEVPDPSFGVSSPIYLDQLNATGQTLRTLAIDPNLVTSSFASKSELAMNLSPDGRSITFMGYKAPKNTLDVSNSNTSAAFDATNPVSSTVQRAVVQVNLNNSSVSVTGVNAYSGNNGRAAVLANGNYYMVGNAGNGSANGTVLSQLSDNTGVQKIAANSVTGVTTPVGMVVGSFGQSNGYQRGFSLTQLPDPANPGHNYAPDKTGKDDNFRGMTVFNDTLYVTKGSGSNGVNSVYRVGGKGALANGGTLNNVPITILPGFNTLSEKVAEATATKTATPHPFGMWFADQTTLFVADEGDGVRLGVNGKGTNFSGLSEYKLVNGTWTGVATFQKGLLDQPTYTAGLPWDVKTDGLRNITGRTNSDGSFTLFGTTSTVSNELTHDLGADPNEIVSITIGSGSTASNTLFTVLKTAGYGSRFGGVVLTPVPEPETYALVLAGLAIVCGVARRQRQA